MIFNLFTLFLSLKIQALSIDITQTNLLKATGLSETTLTSQTEKALDAYLFYDEGGMSCDLDSFEMDTFTITEGSIAQPTRFEVVVKADGPGQTCQEKDQYQCYVTWKLKSQVWQPVLVECDDNLYEE